jgi:hypothetical protein
MMHVRRAHLAVALLGFGLAGSACEMVAKIDREQIPWPDAGDEAGQDGASDADTDAGIDAGADTDIDSGADR